MRGKKGHDGEVNFEGDDTSTDDQQQNEIKLEFNDQQSDVHLHEHTVSANELAKNSFSYYSTFLFFSIIRFRERSTFMRRMVGRREVVAVAEARDAGGVNTTTILSTIV